MTVGTLAVDHIEDNSVGDTYIARRAAPYLISYASMHLIPVKLIVDVKIFHSGIRESFEFKTNYILRAYRFNIDKSLCKLSEQLTPLLRHDIGRISGFKFKTCRST